MQRKLTLALACLLATLGVAAGLFAFPARADNSYGAHSIDDLAALGYRFGAFGGVNSAANPLGCANIVVISYGDVDVPDGQQPVVEINPDPNHPGCVTPPDQIQANIDAIIAAYPPAPRTPDPVPATTTTTTAAPAPVDAPPAAAPAPGGTQTVTVSDPTLQAQIDALNAKIDALTSRVDKLAEANTASWTAFSDALTAGASAADAALAARSAGLNSLYGL